METIPIHSNGLIELKPIECFKSILDKKQWDIFEPCLKDKACYIDWNWGLVSYPEDENWLLWSGLWGFDWGDNFKVRSQVNCDKFITVNKEQQTELLSPMLLNIIIPKIKEKNKTIVCILSTNQPVMYSLLQKAGFNHSKFYPNSTHDCETSVCLMSYSKKSFPEHFFKHCSSFGSCGFSLLTQEGKCYGKDEHESKLILMNSNYLEILDRAGSKIKEKDKVECVLISGNSYYITNRNNIQKKR